MLRYVDDLALFADRPEPLHAAHRALNHELGALRLRLHPTKTRLLPTALGASFVGFHVIGGRISLRYHSLLRIRRGLRRCARALAHHRVTTQRAFASAQSRDAHLAHGHTHELRRRLFAAHAFS
jgi:RNA-directed DNA polymerase